MSMQKREHLERASAIYNNDVAAGLADDPIMNAAALNKLDLGPHLAAMEDPDYGQPCTMTSTSTSMRPTLLRSFPPTPSPQCRVAWFTTRASRCFVLIHVPSALLCPNWGLRHEVQDLSGLHSSSVAEGSLDFGLILTIFHSHFSALCRTAHVAMTCYS